MPARWSSATAVSIFATRCGFAPRFGQPGAHRLDVFGTAHERETDEVGLDLHGHLERDRVGVGERLDVTFGARHVHALARPQHSGAHDAAPHVVAVDALDAQHDRAVGEEHFVADAHPAREIGDGRGHAVLVALDRLGGQHDLGVDAQLDLVVHDRSGAQLRAGQVDEHADRAVERGRRGARASPRARRAPRACRAPR